MESEQFQLTFNGSGDVEKFLRKCNLHSSLKGHNGVKSAQFVASRLDGRAFDVYLRLSDDDKKSFNRIKEELLKEFQRGNQDREVAIHELSSRSRLPQEAPQTYAFKLIELVKLAYPTFPENVQLTIAKDFFIKGIHPEMQVALKSLSNFTECDTTALSRETVRLELAGVKGNPSSNLPVQEVKTVTDDTDLVESIASKVMEKMQDLSLDANQVSQGNSNQYHRGRRGNWHRVGNYRGRGGRGNAQRQPPRCRNCQISGHIVKDCPSRFYQACGDKGHDAWNPSCPNYQ